MAEPWAVVTRGARNIGQAIGRKLLSDGYRVITLDIVALEEPSLQADALLVDLSDHQAAETTFAEVAGFRGLCPCQQRRRRAACCVRFR